MGRLGRAAGSRVHAVRQRWHPYRSGAAARCRSRELLRGVFERDALAAVPRRDRTAVVPSRVVGQLCPRQPAFCCRCCRGQRTGRGRLGTGLSTAARAETAARASRRPHDRVFQPHPVPSIRHLLAATLAHTDHRGPARRRCHRLPADRGCEQFRACRSSPQGLCHEEPDYRGSPRGRIARRSRARADPAGQTLSHGGGQEVPDLDRFAQLRGTGAPRRHPGQGQADSGGSRQPENDHARSRPPRLHQGHRPST